MASQTKKPLRLGHLATRKLTTVLQTSVSNMNRCIAADIKKQFSTPHPSSPKDKNKSNDASKDVKSSSPRSKPITQMTCARAALQMMTVRKYLMRGMANPSATKMTLTPKVVQELISTAVDTKCFGLIRLILCDWINVLDFRALDIYSSSRPEIPNWRQTPAQTAACVSSSSSEISLNKVTPTPLSTFFLPPDEFDWFSGDRLGRIVTMSEACELFSILGMSQVAPKVRELYLNARRKEYWACPPDIMEITADILLQLGGLTTLVLRGMCDDYMLKLVGQSSPSLKLLDISGSHFVTDAGVKNLFFKDVTENPATYLMKSFIEKNLKNMNPLVNSLEMLDYSFTNVTGLGRKMIGYLPQSFVFKRVFAKNENFSYGHHIFLRRKCAIHLKIPPENGSGRTEFEDILGPMAGIAGAKALSKFVENHPWKNCSLHIYQDQDVTVADRMDGPISKFYGIVTSSNEENRVYGTVTFQDSDLIEMYSMFPVNINILGESCPKLQVFRGIVTDFWKRRSSVLSDLTILDMFADPVTTKSVLESAPNLRKVRIRMVRERLTDEYIIKPLTTFMCCRTLEELWISPGTFGSSSNSEQSVNANSEREDKDFRWQAFNEVRANYYAAERPPRNKASVNVPIQNNNNNNQLEQGASSSDELDCDNCEIDDLVHLTADCIRTILQSCPRLQRIGDIAWWTPVSQSDLETICKQLKTARREVTFVWENEIFPKN